MKNLRLIFIGAVALLAFVSCNDKESKPDDSYYASQASISSSDNLFTASSNGGTITFSAEGGQVVVNVDCQTDWTATNSNPEWLEIIPNVEYQRVVVSAEQSTVETQQSATVTLATAEQGIQFAVITVTQDAYNTPTITVEASECSFPAVGELTAEIAVTANADWTVQNTSTWLTAEKTDSGLKLTAAENENAETRSVDLTLSCSDGISSSTATIAVTQDALAYLTLSGYAFTFYGDADSSTIDVESNYDWEISYDSSNGWFTAEQKDGSLVVTVTEDDEEGDRQGTVTITAGDGAANVAEATVTVLQHSINALVFEYTTPEDNVEVVIPIYGTVSCTVDWGDGSAAESVSAQYPGHTYASAGVYYISVTGTVTSISHSYVYPTREYLTGLKQWGHTGLTSLYAGFYECANLKYLPEHTGTSLEAIAHNFLSTEFMEAFGECTSLESIPADLFADCPNATALWNTFYQCASLKEIPEGLFDSGQFTAFQGVFQNCSSLTTIPVGLFDKCTKVTVFKDSFNGCSRLAGESPYTVVDGTKVHLYERTTDNGFSAPTSYSGCFSGCTSLTDYDNIPSGWK